MNYDANNSLIVLAHEAACLLEMYVDPSDWHAVFEDLLDGLASTKEVLRMKGLPVPVVVEHVLRVAELHPKHA
jgi:hypothetical protein